jgi:hypothetical protein
MSADSDVQRLVLFIESACGAAKSVTGENVGTVHTPKGTVEYIVATQPRPDTVLRWATLKGSNWAIRVTVVIGGKQGARFHVKAHWEGDEVCNVQKKVGQPRNGTFEPTKLYRILACIKSFRQKFKS